MNSLSSDVKLQLLNASSRKCWMGGFPAFQLFDGKGRTLGIPFTGQDAAQRGSFGDIKPGESAQTILRWNGPFCLGFTVPLHVRLTTPNGDTVDVVPKPNLAGPGCRRGLKARTSTLTSGGWTAKPTKP